jgi:hypothetical protein
MPKLPPLSQSHLTNFNTLLRAVASHDLAIISALDKRTGQLTAVVAAVNQVTKDGKTTYEFIPLARMFDGNPYQEVSISGEITKSNKKKKDTK